MGVKVESEKWKVKSGKALLYSEYIQIGKYILFIIQY